MNENKELVDLKTYLQRELDAIEVGFVVLDERELNGDIEKEVVISQLVGNSNKYNASISYQLDIFTTDIENVQRVFEKFASTHSQTSFEYTFKGSDEITHVNTITQNWTTPVVMDKDVEIGSDHFARIVVYGSLFILKDSANVKSISVNNETIDFENGTIAWQNNALSNRVSGRSNNKNFSESAATSIAFLMKSQKGEFIDKLQMLRTGAISRETYFNVKVELTDGTIENYKMLIQRQTLTFARTGIPNYEIAMVEYEDFSDDVEVI